MDVSDSYNVLSSAKGEEGLLAIGQEAQALVAILVPSMSLDD